MNVAIYHNDGPDNYSGYADGQSLRKVFAFTWSEPPMPSDIAMLEHVFYLFNVGDEAGHPLALDYRSKRLRSLSVGDVVVIDGTAWACASVGWEEVKPGLTAAPRVCPGISGPPCGNEPAPGDHWCPGCRAELAAMPTEAD